MARYCAHCGNQLTEGEKFCPVCGSPVEQPAAPDGRREEKTPRPSRGPGPSSLPALSSPRETCPIRAAGENGSPW